MISKPRPSACRSSNPAPVTPIGSFEQKPGVELILGLGTGLGAAALVEVGRPPSRFAERGRTYGFRAGGSGGNRDLAPSRHRRPRPGLRGNGPLRLRPPASPPGALRGGGPNHGHLQRNRANRTSASGPFERGGADLAAVLDSHRRVSRAISPSAFLAGEASLLRAESCPESSIFVIRKNFARPSRTRRPIAR